MRVIQTGLLFLLIVFSALTVNAIDDQKDAIKIGIIGCDTSHVIAFADIFRDANASEPLAGFTVVAAFPGGSPDIPSSISRVPEYVEQLQSRGVVIVDSIDQVCARSDAIMLLSLDGRKHLEQAKVVLQSGKRLFIDKPVAGSLADAIRLFDYASKCGTPMFSSSSLRFGCGVDALKLDNRFERILGASTFGPALLEPHHPDLYWYGVHGCELLCSIMGTGCQSVSCMRTDGTDVVTGQWSDGRIGNFRGLREGVHDYGATVFGSKGIGQTPNYEGYKPLIEAMATFFRTGVAPVSSAETIELFALMEAADESVRRGGSVVHMAEVVDEARRHIEMASELAQEVKTIEDMNRRRPLIRQAMQWVMGTEPDRSQLAAVTTETLSETVKVGYRVNELRMRVGPNRIVPALLYLPDILTKDQPRPAVLALHQTSSHGKREVDGVGKPDQAYGRELAELGYVVLAPDYPSFGDYPCEFDDPAFVSGTMLAIFNHRRCIDFLENVPGVDAKRIGAIGHSLGGHNALFLAAMDERIQAVVSCCGWSTFESYGDLTGWSSPRYMPRIKTFYHLNANQLPFEFTDVLRAIAPRPLMSVAPLRDDNFPIAGVEPSVEEVRKLYSLCGEAGNLILRKPDADHSFPTHERNAAYEFLARHLRLHQ
jgi:dienelactone hydrolase